MKPEFAGSVWVLWRYWREIEALLKSRRMKMEVYIWKSWRNTDICFGSFLSFLCGATYKAQKDTVHWQHVIFWHILLLIHWNCRRLLWVDFLFKWCLRKSVGPQDRFNRLSLPTASSLHTKYVKCVLMALCFILICDGLRGYVLL